MNNDIIFYIPSDQTIPTDLRLKTEDAHIYYERLPETFGYKFRIYHPGAQEVPSVQKDRELVEDIAHRMCAQSYDHGASWRIRGIILINIAEDLTSCNTFHVLFRIRDAG
jgi:hypothetical protein